MIQKLECILTNHRILRIKSQTRKESKKLTKEKSNWRVIIWKE